MCSETITTKQCTRCGQVQSLDSFCKDKSRKDGLFPQCKTCKKEGKQKYYLENKEEIIAKTIAWHKNNPEKVLEIKRRCQSKHREEYNMRAKERYLSDPDKYRTEKNEWRKKNRERVLAQAKARYKANPEKAKERYQKHRNRHREEMNRRSREWYKNNKETHLERTKRWRRNNPDKALSVVHRRRCRIEQSTSHYTAEQWQSLKAYYDFKCLCCGQQEPTIKLTIDHVIPLSGNGDNSIENIQPLCLRCNQQKNTKSTDYRTKEIINERC